MHWELLDFCEGLAHSMLLDNSLQALICSDSEESHHIKVCVLPEP